MFEFGWFASHSGFQLPWKLNCDDLTDRDWSELAKLVAWKFAFRAVYGIPRGGTKFARALEPHAEPKSNYPLLIVDDVLTTGRSFIDARAALGNPLGTIGVVLVARCPKDELSISVPNWVFPILTVNEWAQSRATGLG